MKADVHRNLRTGTYSVINRKTGRVQSHPETTAVSDAEFVVQNAGPERVRESGQKDVHAFVRGTKTAGQLALPEGRPERVTYDPFKYDSFVRVEDETPVERASLVLALPDGVLYAYGLE